MHSDAEDVDGYLALVPEGRRAVLSLLTDFEESMRYGMPAYSRNGITEISWASQKQKKAGNG